MKIIDLNLNYADIRDRIEIDKAQFKISQWAELTGTSRNVISNIHGKSGKHNPSLQYIIAVSRATGKSVEWYLYGQKDLKNTVCPTCGNWSEDVKEACRKLREIMESGDDLARETILNNLDLIGRGVGKGAGRPGKKDLPQSRTDMEPPARKRKQTAAR